MTARFRGYAVRGDESGFDLFFGDDELRAGFTRLLRDGSDRVCESRLGGTFDVAIVSRFPTALS